MAVTDAPLNDTTPRVSEQSSTAELLAQQPACIVDITEPGVDAGPLASAVAAAVTQAIAATQQQRDR